MKRLLSIDTLRGMDMLMIMGLGSLIISICALFPESGAAQWIASQMHHASWDGLRLEDTIFPLFLFLAGVSFPFSLNNQTIAGKSRRSVYLRVLRRGLILIALGIVYNGFFQLNFDHMRIASVLGRIGLAWMLAAFLFMNLRSTPLVIVSAVILIGYWLALWLIPGGADPFSLENNLVGAIDLVLMPGHLYLDTFDPEGLFSTLPAIVTALMGMLTGQYVRTYPDVASKKQAKPWHASARMLGVALILIAIGLLWSRFFPINKALWSSSFVCVVGGWSLALFAILHYLVDVKGFTRWTFFFRVIGMNSITIYMAQAIIGFRAITRFFLGGTARLCGESWGDILLNAGYIAVCWLFLYFLYKKKIFLKI